MKTKILGIVMAGGEGTRLQPLTRDRAKPAVPFGGKYRIIDFVLSNFINSEMYAIHVLVQFKSQSLIEHLQAGWRFGGFPTDQYFISTVPAQMRTGQTWYQGTADSVYQNLHLIKQFKPDIVAVFGADHIYRMDIRQMVEFHLERDAEVTVSAFPVVVSEGSAFGILQTDRQGYITGFEEKPAQPQAMPGDPDYCLASMGNYLFSTPVLINLLEKNARAATGHDFGRDIIPQLIGDRPVYAYAGGMWGPWMPTMRRIWTCGTFVPCSTSTTPTGQFVPRHPFCRRPSLRLTRRADEVWRFSRLFLRDPSSAVPRW